MITIKPLDKNSAIIAHEITGLERADANFTPHLNHVEIDQSKSDLHDLVINNKARKSLCLPKLGCIIS